LIGDEKLMVGFVVSNNYHQFLRWPTPHNLEH